MLWKLNATNRERCRVWDLSHSTKDEIILSKVNVLLLLSYKAETDCFGSLSSRKKTMMPEWLRTFLAPTAYK
jgi:hypothetical protein